MAKRVKVKVPLYSGRRVIEFQPSCCYCGQPADECWEETFEYNLMEWRRYRKTGQVLEQTKEGEKGKVTLKAPYCPRCLAHRKRVTTLTNASLALFFAVVGVPCGYVTIREFWEPNVVAILLSLFMGLLVFSLGGLIVAAIFITVVKLALSLFSSTWRDTPIPMIQNGTLGLFASVKEHSAGPGLPFYYNLVLSFSNPDRAKKFVEAHPSAHIP